VGTLRPGEDVEVSGPAEGEGEEGWESTAQRLVPLPGA
jgi:hypothetical protein